MFDIPLRLSGSAHGLYLGCQTYDRGCLVCFGLLIFLRRESSPASQGAKIEAILIRQI